MRWIAACIVLAAFQDKEPSRTDYTKLEKLVLRDVQGLFGGQDFYLKKDGTLTVVIAKPVEGKPGLQASEYASKLDEKEMAALIELLKKHDFVSIRTQKRPGVPDEAHPEITLRLEKQAACTIRKWANEEHPDFDAIYKALLDRCTAAAKTKAVREEKYDYAWRPKGFEE